jgi:hypothetical protein
VYIHLAILLWSLRARLLKEIYGTNYTVWALFG